MSYYVANLKEQIASLSRDLAGVLLEVIQWQQAFERTCDDLAAARREIDDKACAIKAYLPEITRLRLEKEEMRESLEAGVDAYAEDCVKHKEAELRKRTIEGCARLAEGDVYKERYRTWPFSSGDWSRDGEIVKHCDKIAAAIRALSAQPAPKRCPVTNVYCTERCDHWGCKLVQPDPHKEKSKPFHVDALDLTTGEATIDGRVHTARECLCNICCHLRTVFADLGSGK